MSTLKVDAIRHNSATSDAITMASDGTCSAKLTSVAGAQLSNRRINVNGAMTISQKGTSVSGNADNGYPLVTDMVNYRRTGGWSGTTWTVSNNTQTPTTLSPFTNFTRWTQAGTVQSAPNDTSTKLQYKIEGQDMAHAMWGTSSAKSCTLSFYVRSSQSGTYCIWCASSDTNYNYVIEYTISAPNTWQRVTHTIPGPTSGTFNTDNTAGIIFYFIIAGHAASSTYGGATKNVWNTSGRWTSNQSTAVSANAGATWDITGIQFEVGDTATSFEHRNHQDELRRCRRYFCKYVGNLNINFVNEHPANTSGYIHFPFYETMRVAPTVTVGSNVSIARPQVGVTQKVQSVDSISTDCFNVIRWNGQGNLGSTGDASYRMGLSAGDSNAFINCSAEL